MPLIRRQADFWEFWYPELHSKTMSKQHLKNFHFLYEYLRTYMYVCYVYAVPAEARRSFETVASIWVLVTEPGSSARTVSADVFNYDFAVCII